MLSKIKTDVSICKVLSLQRLCFVSEILIFKLKEIELILIIIDEINLADIKYPENLWIYA